MDGVTFDSAIFTNLSRDHIDYHGSMEAYFESKAGLFLDFDVRNRIVCLDTEYGSEEANARRDLADGFDSTEPAIRDGLLLLVGLFAAGAASWATGCPAGPEAPPPIARDQIRLGAADAMLAGAGIPKKTAPTWPRRSRGKSVSRTLFSMPKS